MWQQNVTMLFPNCLYHWPVIYKKWYAVVKIKVNSWWNGPLLGSKRSRHFRNEMSGFEPESGPIQQLQKCMVFRNYLMYFYRKYIYIYIYLYIYKCMQTYAKIINSYFTKWCTIKCIMIWSCRCCPKSGCCETGCPSYNHKACGCETGRSLFKTDMVAKMVIQTTIDVQSPYQKAYILRGPCPGWNLG